MLRYIYLLLLTVISVYTHATTLHIQMDKDVRENSTVQQAEKDISSLLEKHTNTKVSASADNADVEFILVKNTTFRTSNNFDSITLYGGFKWTVNTQNGKTIFHLYSDTYKGFADGLYAFLQEQTGFKFYHTRSYLPPANPDIEWQQLTSLTGKPVFEKMGFHIHSMHPLEITESLLDETYPNALNNVKEYIDWLARSGQNYFEFNLLESINRKSWIAHAQQITAYAHSRGIFCGVDLSIHMIQQKAFQLYSGMAHQQQKIEKSAAWLLPAGFDVWNVELSTTEFSQGNQSKKMQQIQLLNSILEKNGVKLMSRSHVVKPDKMVSGNKVSSNDNILPARHGLMVHTVMFYSMLDSIAPVYENKNLQHMRDILLKEKSKREVWYYPESAYWITFDNSVPMLLLPYLSARLEDINYCEQEQVTGHLTFSSGWEWGYWLIDWSIARWSWNYSKNDIPVTKNALQYVHDISSNKNFTDYVDRSLELQQQHIKDEQLIRVMTAQTITDEIGGKFNLEFHPRPQYPYKYIRNKANTEELAFVQRNYLDKLKIFTDVSEKNTTDTSHLNAVEQEIYDGIQITYLRAMHRYQTLSYLVHYRTDKLAKTKKDLSTYLNDAEKVRLSALAIVRHREQGYRYPVTAMSTQRKDHTCYHFGYLFPVHDLHFWEREEKQAKKNKYKFWYMNIWNIARIIGIIN